MSRRAKLESLLAAAPRDSFLRYSLALEFVKENDREQALAALRTLAADDQDYHAACFRLGQLLHEDDLDDEAGRWLDQGIAAARRLGDSKAANEMAEFRQLL
jgi:tetratricopeptide (TPR) repeat protein